MNKTVIEILEHEGPASFVTAGNDGPHMAATWNSYIEIASDSVVIIPVGSLKKTEENIHAGSKVQMIVASKDIQGKNGPGAGFLLKGTAQFKNTGMDFERTRSRFPWARAIMLFTIEEETPLL